MKNGPTTRKTSLGGGLFSHPSIPRKSQHEHSSIIGQQAYCQARIVSAVALDLKLFDGMFKNGEEVQQTVMVFVNQMLAHFVEEGCLDAVERHVPIKVASAGVSREALNREFGEEAVARVRVA